MRLHRVTLENFRGVDRAKVEFDPAGITVVEGRNESGKTSLMDALLFLLDEKHSSQKQSLKRAKPVGRDVGPAVEAEITVGTYSFVYRKQWLKNAFTELAFSAPRVEQLTGNDAHDRVLRILADETDYDLFRALRYQQGEVIVQAAIGSSPSLAAALDAAAGGTGRAGNATDDKLVERIETERLRYFTPGGQPAAERKKKLDALQALNDEAATIASRIRAVENDVENHRLGEEALQTLRTEVEPTNDQVAEARKRLQEVEALEQFANNARDQARNAASLREARDAEAATRKQLVDTAAQAKAALDAVRQEIAAAADGLAAAQSAADEAKTAHETAAAAVAKIEAEHTVAASVLERAQLAIDLELLERRLKRVHETDETIAAAEAFLGGCGVDDALLDLINNGVRELDIAKARAQAEQPELTVEAIRPLKATLNGRALRIEPGLPLEQRVTGALEIVLDEVARIRVARPESASQSEAALTQADAALARHLKTAGVTSVAAAQEAIKERHRHVAARDNARQRRNDALGDLDLPALMGKVDRARQRVAALGGEPDGADASSLEDARAAFKEVDEELRAARQAAADRESALNGARAALQEYTNADIARQSTLKSRAEAAERGERALAEARATVSDDEIERTAAAARAADQNAAAALSSAEQKLATADPGTARAVLDNSEQKQQGIAAEIHRHEVDLAGISARLDLAGNEGLDGRLAEKRAKLDALKHDVEAETRRAAAVERLHAVITEERAKAQQAYAGPFREKVNAYAKILYGREVELRVAPDTLAIESRTLDGATVPFEDLSGGAREQLAVLARLACAALVSPSNSSGAPGGVPVVVDDALGYSDPGRLEALGAAFGVAGRDCQVIVLTCEPGRYRHIGGAKVVAIEGQSRG